MTSASRIENLLEKFEYGDKDNAALTSEENRVDKAFIMVLLFCFKEWVTDRPKPAGSEQREVAHSSMSAFNAEGITQKDLFSLTDEKTNDSLR